MHLTSVHFLFFHCRVSQQNPERKLCFILLRDTAHTSRSPAIFLVWRGLFNVYVPFSNFNTASLEQLSCIKQTHARITHTHKARVSGKTPCNGAFCSRLPEMRILSNPAAPVGESLPPPVLHLTSIYRAWSSNLSEKQRCSWNQWLRSNRKKLSNSCLSVFILWAIRLRYRTCIAGLPRSLPSRQKCESKVFRTLDIG